MKLDADFFKRVKQYLVDFSKDPIFYDIELKYNETTENIEGRIPREIMIKFKLSDDEMNRLIQQAVSEVKKTMSREIIYREVSF